MNSWKELGAVVSDPRPGEDTALWNELLEATARFDARLYVKLIGLRLAGAELAPSTRFRWRLGMANDAVVKEQDVKALLAPHTGLLINLFLNLGGEDNRHQESNP